MSVNFFSFMSSDKRNIGSKINDNGWIDFQGNSGWRKPILDLYAGQSTTFETSNLKELLKEFIDVTKTYSFQGVKINPEVNEVLKKFKNQNGKITKFRKRDDLDYQMGVSPQLIETYFTALKQELSKEKIPFVSYELATKDWNSYVPGISSWPTIFVTPVNNTTDLIDKVNSMNNFYERLKEIESPQFYQINKIDIIRNKNIQPLIMDEDTSFEVTGELVQKMSNLLLTYRGVYELPNHNDGDL